LKLISLFQLIGVLLISITFYTYVANIVFSCNLALTAMLELVIINHWFLSQVTPGTDGSTTSNRTKPADL